MRARIFGFMKITSFHVFGLRVVCDNDFRPLEAIGKRMFRNPLTVLWRDGIEARDVRGRGTEEGLVLDGGKQVPVHDHSIGKSGQVGIKSVMPLIDMPDQFIRVFMPAD